MTEGNKQKKIITNTGYTMGAMFLLNGVLQLIIYPLMNRSMGAEQLGTVLYLLGLVAILCPSVGQALNTSRLVVQRTHTVSNGDYNFALLFFGGIGTLITMGIGHSSIQNVGTAIFLIFLFMITIFRYYGDVEYRLNLNYRKYFVYYLCISIGYLAGYGVYLLGGSWFFIFLLGECAACIYVGITGSIYRGFFTCSSCRKIAFSRGFLLILSYLITNLTLNIDRLALNYYIGSLAVTQFYVVSLLGKTMVLLVAPINTIVLSYLTKREKNLDRTQFMKMTGAGVLVSILFFVACQIGTPLFVRIFYSDLYESVRSLVTIVNLAQILGVLSAFLFILVLTFTSEKWQLALQVMHLIVITISVIVLTPAYGLFGFSCGVLIANGVRILAVIVLGVVKADKGEKSTCRQEK